MTKGSRYWCMSCHNWHTPEAVWESIWSARRIVPRLSPQSKYRNIRTEVDGISFASRREAHRYTELCILEKAGRISGLELQPRYPLVVNGVKVTTYVADFRYTEAGETVVEDVKSEPTKTPVYKLKKALMKALYDIEIRET